MGGQAHRIASQRFYPLAVGRQGLAGRTCAAGVDIRTSNTAEIVLLVVVLFQYSGQTAQCLPTSHLPTNSSGTLPTAMYRPRHNDNDDADDGHDSVPLHHKRPYGAGLKRTRVEFVHAQQPDEDTAYRPSAPAGDLYASVVLGHEPASSAADAPSSSASRGDHQASDGLSSAPPICPVCSLPVTTTVREHDASLAHQVSLAHSHPPSALDRKRMGLRALSAQGWDPDSRLGLGRQGEGVRFPIKASAKEDTLGIGATMPETARVDQRKEVRRMSAKEIKANTKSEKEKEERLQQEIFGSVNIERYLRP